MNTPATPRPVCLFLVNGLGMGNSTRCYAVIEELVARGAVVHVATSGNGLTYFKDKPALASITPVEAFFYRNARRGVSAWRTLFAVGKLAGIAARKSRQLDALLERVKPDVVVTDSEYTLGPMRRRRIPVAAINNSDVVVTECRDGRPVPRDVRSHLWIVEYMDYLFHRTQCAVVISPSAKPHPPPHPRLRRVGLILRRSVRERIPEQDVSRPPSTARNVLFMLSGSVFASAVPMNGAHLPFKIHVVGREGQNQDNIEYHGKLMDNIACLMAADVIVLNGGFSAVSEALALRKPTFVIPVPRHAEQFVNARTVADLGIGYVVNEHNVLDRMTALWSADRWEGFSPTKPLTGYDGAREAAEIIIETATSHAGPSSPARPGSRP